MSVGGRQAGRASKPLCGRYSKRGEKSHSLATGRICAAGKEEPGLLGNMEGVWRLRGDRLLVNSECAWQE